jgi:hypothetical protein
MPDLVAYVETTARRLGVTVEEVWSRMTTVEGLVDGG